jgi:uncharacterized protein (DUF934 family)
MAIANRKIKARTKANPDRIKSDISNSKLIKNSEVVDNAVLHIAESEEFDINSLPAGNVSVPLSVWLEHKETIKAREGLTAVQVAADEAVEALAEDLQDIDIVVLPFVNFVDGRSYSHANDLRLRHKFTGEIRAVGDVHFDHLHFLTRCGCDAFELPDGDDHQAALAAFTEFSEVYQPAADGAPLIFSRRRAIY